MLVDRNLQAKDPNDVMCTNCLRLHLIYHCLFCSRLTRSVFYLWSIDTWGTTFPNASAGRAWH